MSNDQVEIIKLLAEIQASSTYIRQTLDDVKNDVSKLGDASQDNTQMLYRHQSMIDQLKKDVGELERKVERKPARHTVKSASLIGVIIAAFEIIKMLVQSLIQQPK